MSLTLRNFATFHALSRHGNGRSLLDVILSHPLLCYVSFFVRKHGKEGGVGIWHQRGARSCSSYNATLYNDYVIGKIFNLYRNKNAVVVYLSDHGEEEYDYRDSKGRKHCSKEQTPQWLKYVNCVPFVIWCSDSYQAKHPEVVKEISNALHRPFITDQVSQVLFHLAGMRSRYHKPANDILSPCYKARKRILLNGLCFDDYDIK